MLPHRGRRLVVMLEPGDMITIRHERSRLAYSTTISAVYDLAVRQAVIAAKADKVRARKLKAKK